MALYIKKAFTYQEADSEKRAEYLESISNTSIDELVYIDESSIDYNICSDKGWIKKGEVLHDKKSGKHYEKINIVAGWNNGKILAPMTFHGSCNTAVFNAWVEQSLIKELTKGQTVVLDNASFHKSQKTIELIESVGCNVVFLPPYSPDLNPIEKFWANMKRWIKKHIVIFKCMTDTIKRFFNQENVNKNQPFRRKME